jgi:hypothetical protein
LKRQSYGWRRRASAIRDHLGHTSGSPLPMRSKERPIVPPPNLPRPAGCWAAAPFTALPR